MLIFNIYQPVNTRKSYTKLESKRFLKMFFFKVNELIPCVGRISKSTEERLLLSNKVANGDFQTE